MSFICIVCRDLITPAGEGNNADLVVTKCGHLYHLNCLEGWFNSRDYPRMECPYCKTKVVQGELQRIFPSGDEETDEIINRYQDAKTQYGVNHQLQEEIDEKLGQLVEFQSKYEDERLVHDLLRFEHTKFVNEAKGKVKVKIQDILKNAEQEKEILMEEAEAIKIQLIAELEKKDKENLVLKQKLEEQFDRIKTLKEQKSSLRSLLMAEKANKNVTLTTSNGQRQEIAVDLCIQLLQKLKPNATPGAGNGFNSADLQMLGEESMNDLSGSVPVVVKEPEEIIDTDDPVEIKVEEEEMEDNSHASFEAFEGGNNTESDSHTTSTSSSEYGADRESEGPGGINTESTTPDTSANESKSILDESCEDYIDASSFADDSLYPNPTTTNRLRSPSPSFLDVPHSTHHELDVTRSDMADMTLVTKAN